MKSPDTERNRRILIVDDSRAIHDDFRKILAGATASTPSSQFEQTLFGITKAQVAVSGLQLDSATQGAGALALVERALFVSRRTEQLRRREDRYRLIAENAGGLVRSNAASKQGSSSTNKILCEFTKRNLRERPCDFPPPQPERKRPILTELSSRKNLRPAIHRPETGIAQLATAND